MNQTHGPYELVKAGGRCIIARNDPDHARSVAFVETVAEWDKFTAAIDAGLDEVAAVHAIDVTLPRHRTV